VLERIKATRARGIVAERRFENQNPDLSLSLYIMKYVKRFSFLHSYPVSRFLKWICETIPSQSEWWEIFFHHFPSLVRNVGW